jgi:hypothetical protein
LLMGSKTKFGSFQTVISFNSQNEGAAVCDR